jgi:hypothetical protein
MLGGPQARERLDEVEEPAKSGKRWMTAAAAPRAGAIVTSLRGAAVLRGGPST